jgi:3-deoxy-manno-octulosonate cytidylyltransferase (CMP-KDO synthetase)
MSPSRRRAVAIIPVRLESSRLPNKAIADICGLPMIVHVYKRCLLAKSLDKVFVATDNKVIKKIVEMHGGSVILTSSNHQTGTDRIAEAAANIDAEVIVNVQGDEALVNPNYIDKLVNLTCEDSSIKFGMLVNNFSKKNSPSDIKVVLNKYNNVMYLSRTDIPSHHRSINQSMLKAYHIVSFSKEYLLRFSKWDKGLLEQIEYNEYLRILENGYDIHAVNVESDAVSVDTIEDLNYVRIKMLKDPFYELYMNFAKN